jgi:hypothetical protein
MGVVNSDSVASTVLASAACISAVSVVSVALTTTTGNVISGKRAYLSEPNAIRPIVAIASQQQIVSQAFWIARRERLKRSRKEVKIKGSAEK